MSENARTRGSAGRMKIPFVRSPRMCIETSHYDGALSNSEFYCHKMNFAMKTPYYVLLRSIYMKHKKVTSTMVVAKMGTHGFSYTHMSENPQI